MRAVVADCHSAATLRTAQCLHGVLGGVSGERTLEKRSLAGYPTLFCAGYRLAMAAWPLVALRCLYSEVV